MLQLRIRELTNINLFERYRPSSLYFIASNTDILLKMVAVGNEMSCMELLLVNSLSFFPCYGIQVSKKQNVSSLLAKYCGVSMTER